LSPALKPGEKIWSFWNTPQVMPFASRHDRTERGFRARQQE
jgi:hypothetical protein